MKIAYAILAHKNHEQVATLAEAIKESWADVFIHLDAKWEISPDDFTRSCKVPVELIVPRVKVYWGDLSIVLATLKLLESICDKGICYDRIVLLSGQDLPIATNATIRDFFSINARQEFLEFAELPVWWWPYGGLDRVQVFNFPTLLGPFWNKAARAIQMAQPLLRRSLRGVKIFGSSQWFNVTGNAARYILETVKSTKILNSFHYSYCADELFFQTKLLNSSFAKNCVNRNLRFMKWPKGASGPVVLPSYRP